MLTTITTLAVIGWVVGLVYDLSSPKVEDPRMHAFLAIISCMLLWDQYGWASCIIGLLETVYAVLVIIHYRDRWKFIGHEARMKRESPESRIRHIIEDMSESS